MVKHRFFSGSTGVVPWVARLLQGVASGAGTAGVAAPGGRSKALGGSPGDATPGVPEMQLWHRGVELHSQDQWHLKTVS